MIIKKEIKSNRGRPRKEFKPRHKRLKEQAKVQVQTSTKIIEHTIPKTERILRMPSKDKSIFYLFIFSIILFLCSIFISFIKKNDIQTLQNGNKQDTSITGEILNTQETEIQSSWGITQVVENMYNAINRKDIDELNNYRDSSLKASNTVRTYFNTKRLTRFVDGISNNTIIIRNIQKETIKEYSWKVTYEIAYTLVDGKTFEEQWNTTVIKKDDTYKIASIKCETAGCSRMPFFNPGKYLLK